MKVSPALAQLLADRRKAFNGKVASLRSRNPGFDTAALSAFLIDPLDPLLARVLEARPDGGAAFVDAGFDMALALVEHGWAGNGPRGTIIGHLWRELAPAMAPMIAANPRETIGALSNSAIKLAGLPEVRLADWIACLRQLGASAASPQELRSLAIIAAWRSGAAHLRAAALAAAINPELACAIVGAAAGAEWSELTERFAAQRWWTPDGSTPANGHRLGRFIGFGGDLAEPPELSVIDDNFILSSGGKHFMLEADGFGAVLRRAGADYAAAAKPATPARLDAQNQLRADDRMVPCDWPANGLMLAVTSDSMAVVSSHSHAVMVFPRAMP